MSDGASIRLVLAVALAALAGGCTTSRDVPAGRAAVVDSASPAEGVATGSSSSGARFVRNVIGFQGPESVRYDADQDVFFVSNMTGYGSALDGNGYISRVSAGNPDSASILAQGGKDGVLLDAPKGLALHGDTLWVADIHALRAFDRRTGAPLATIDLAPMRAVQLNDVAIGPDGTIHVTDTGIIMGKDGVVHLGPDRIFVVGPGRAVSIAAEGPQLRRPNGITWDAERVRWIVVSFDPFVGEMASMPADMSSRTVLRSGTGQLDGVEVLRDGTILFSSWADSSIHALRDGRDQQVIREVPVAADIGVDTRRQRVAIPLTMLGRVQLWDIGGLTREAVRAPR
jgi:sugar lactone lactonase YvrE